MKVFKKAILPKGFLASGVSCGIKKSGKSDLALFYSQLPAKSACLFTSSKIKAAPVVLSQEHLKKSHNQQAIIVNSGNANCFTGFKGFQDAEETAIALSAVLGLKKEEVIVASTGIIGKTLPLDKIKQAASGLISSLSVGGISQAKKAILTTDTRSKEITVKFSMGGKIVTICGVAKGVGMISPNLATMLCFVFTDALVSQRALVKALKIATENSFNSITVDGCMSTNDMVAVLANGASGCKLESGNNFSVFQKALNLVCLDLAKQLVADAEGITKFIQINVHEAINFSEAKRAALFIANSNLFKTAVYGENPNFGRIAAAVGASGVHVKEEGFRLKVSPLKKSKIFVDVWLREGKAKATVYTSDLTPEYIKINAEYN